MTTKTTTTQNNENPAAHLQSEPYVNVKAAARFLGVPENTLYKKALDRTIPSYKAGKLRRFKLSELAAWMDNCRVSADE